MVSRFGLLEYAISGNGAPVLMLHGTGGGFDQGLLFAEKIGEQGYRIIAPSRFGYLRSSFPDQPSAEHQADALVDLLDHLGIRQVTVVGGSAGVLSAAAFAARHPERCARLVLLVPAANLGTGDPVHMSAHQEAAVRRLAGSDFLYWAALRLGRDRLVSTLLATDPGLLASATPADRRRIARILDTMMPISRRTAGMLNDGQLAGSPTSLDFRAISCPTLVVSAEDDRFGTAATARSLAAMIAGSRLVVYRRGGHVWLGHDDDVAEKISAFIGRDSR